MTLARICPRARITARTEVARAASVNSETIVPLRLKGFRCAAGGEFRLNSDVPSRFRRSAFGDGLADRSRQSSPIERPRSPRVNRNGAAELFRDGNPADVTRVFAFPLFLPPFFSSLFLSAARLRDPRRERDPRIPCHSEGRHERTRGTRYASIWSCIDSQRRVL